jgi:hypothetical protein
MRGFVIIFFVFFRVFINNKKHTKTDNTDRYNWALRDAYRQSIPLIHMSTWKCVLFLAGVCELLPTAEWTWVGGKGEAWHRPHKPGRHTHRPVEDVGQSAIHRSVLKTSNMLQLSR